MQLASGWTWRVERSVGLGIRRRCKITGDAAGDAHIFGKCIKLCRDLAEIPDLSSEAPNFFCRRCATASPHHFHRFTVPLSKPVFDGARCATLVGSPEPVLLAFRPHGCTSNKSQLDGWLRAWPLSPSDLALTNHLLQHTPSSWSGTVSFHLHTHSLFSHYSYSPSHLNPFSHLVRIASTSPWFALPF